MQIKKLTIENFRSVKSLEVDFSAHSVVLGANNAGKSTVLKAIDLFFEASPKLGAGDHFYSDVNLPIGISVTFSDLTPAERAEFGSAVIDGEMTVSRELSSVDKDSGVYSVTAKVFPEFDAFRQETNGTKKRSIYSKLVKEVPGLATANSVEEMQSALTAWEVENPSKLDAAKIRGFFGAVNVANGKLKKRTSIRLIPAVKETSTEFQDPKRSPILGLLNDIATQIFENRKELQEFIESSREQARKLTDPGDIPQLSNISESLTSAVQRFYGDTKIEAEWVAEDPLRVNFPTPRILLEHRGAKVAVDYVGHGLQRAVLFAIVQYLAERQTVSSDGVEKHSEPLSDLIILIEEPEIYQHPIKQKQIYEAFRRIANGFDAITGIRVQIVYTTHSEKLIDMADFGSVRIIRKSIEGDGGYSTTCNAVTLSKCSELMAKIVGKPQPMPAATFGAKLHIFNRDVSEGFFAEKIVLVEGVSDKAILEGVYRSMGRNPSDEGVAIIAMSGKSTLDKPALIFSELKIPTYVIFDNDKKKSPKKQKPATNILLQKICGIGEPEEWPEGVYDRFAVTPNNLEGYLEVVLGDKYEKLMDQVAVNFELGVDDIRKTPAAVSSLFVLAKAQGIIFKYLEDVVSRVDAMH